MNVVLLLSALLAPGTAFKLSLSASDSSDVQLASRRDFTRQVTTSVAGVLLGATASDAAPVRMQLPPEDKGSSQMVDLPGLRGKDYGKSATLYPDFVQLSNGLQVKDVKIGTGDPPRVGDRAVIDWQGYTIGYNSRPFQLKNGVKGSAFEGDQDLYRFKVGSGAVIPGLDAAVRDMKRGGKRQVIVPAELGYPASDPKHNVVGPRPSTFSGQRALDFVLESQGLVDKTLLFIITLDMRRDGCRFSNGERRMAVQGWLAEAMDCCTVEPSRQEELDPIQEAVRWASRDHAINAIMAADGIKVT
ncbi:unnamed protein product [Chrysoparadoxa australica]